MPAIARPHHIQEADTAHLAKDPVCGMSLDPHTAKRRREHGLMARLKRQFDEEAIVELTALIAFQNLSSKFNAALDVPPQGFCRLPEGA